MGKTKRKKKEEGDKLMKQMLGSIVIGFCFAICIILLFVVARG